MIKVGCCGWAEARCRRDVSVIEDPETFSRPGRIEQCGKGRAAAAGECEFTVKAWQLITHEPSSPTCRRLKSPVSCSTRKRYGSFRPADELFAARDAVDRIAQELGSRIVLFQAPASFLPTAENRRNLRSIFGTIGRRNACVLFNNSAMLFDARCFRRLSQEQERHAEEHPDHRPAGCRQDHGHPEAG